MYGTAGIIINVYTLSQSSFKLVQRKYMIHKAELFQKNIFHKLRIPKE